MFNLFGSTSQHTDIPSDNFKEGDNVGFRSTSKYYDKFGTYMGHHTDTTAKIKLHPGCGGGRIVYASYDSLVHRKCPEGNPCKFKMGDRVSFHKCCKYHGEEGVFEGMDDMYAKVKLINTNINNPLIYVSPDVLHEPTEKVYFTMDTNGNVYLNYDFLKLPVTMVSSSGEQLSIIEDNNIKYLTYKSKQYPILME